MNDGGIPARSPAPSWVTSEASPWTRVGARTIEAPNAAAIDCIPRQTPSRGIPRSRATSTVATDTPADSGSPGPGEITIPRRSAAASARRVGRRGGELDRAAEGRSLVLRLLELPLRDARGDDSRSRMDVGSPLPEDGAPDRDRGVEVAVVAEIADGTTVQPAPLTLGGRDQLHRPDLRRAGQGPGRDDRPERAERIEARSEPALDVGDEMQDVAVALDLHVLADRDCPGSSDPPEVVPPEVDQHDVLRPLLRVALELLGEDLVLSLVRAPRPRPGDRVGRQSVALDLEEQLRARADDLEPGCPREEPV